MPVNANVAIQNVATIAWNGTASFPAAINKFTRFAWSFEIVTTLTADAVFNIQSAPPSLADPCVPGAFVPVPETALCSDTAVAGPQATVVIPAGTLAGAVCSGTIPCRPDVFVRLTAVSGAADVRAVLVRQGPRI